MRASVSIDKNFITGEINKSIKYKGETSTKGIATIQLFDENNNIQREIVTENCISDVIKAYAYEATYKQKLLEGASSIIFPSDMTANILLTSDTEEEDPKKNTVLKSNLIGFAGRTQNYSGSSTIQGTYNSAESSVYTDENGNIVYHKVYDFPTHSANGTINSVCWSPYTSSSVIYKINHTSDFESLVRSTENRHYNFDRTKCVYLVDTGKGIMIVDMENGDINLVKLSQQFDMANIDAYKIIYRENEFIIAGINKSTYDLIVNFYQLDGKISKSLVINGKGKSFNFTGGKTATVYDIAYTNSYAVYVDDDYIYVCAFEKKFVTPMGLNLLKLDREGNQVGVGTYTTWVEDNHPGKDMTNIGSGIVDLYKNNDNSFTLKARLKEDLKTYEFNINSNFEATSLSSKKYSEEQFSIATNPRYIKGYYIHSDISSPIHIVCSDNHYLSYAKTKLPSPITKTNTNTMKVQYDFIYTPPKITDFI